jgi:predicted  nucleic acid-binding Zn-ribbon protein
LNLNVVYLVKLQKLDNRLQQLKRAEIEGPQKMSALDEELISAEVKVKTSVELEEEQKKARRDFERQIEENEERIKKNLERQFRVKNNDEYKALLKEVDFYKKSNSEAEDKVLSLMDEVEKTQQENQELKKWFSEQRESLTQRKKDTEIWVSTSIKDLAKLEAERADLIKDIPHVMMSTYERVYKRGGGVAVVPIIGGICQACHLQIPPQHFNELQRNDKLMTCVNCNRIIYWHEHDDFNNT